MRPYVKRALGRTIVTIESEAIAPYLRALSDADRVLQELASRDATVTWDSASTVELVQRAEAAHRAARPLLDDQLPGEPG
jgi:hypothetical protein